MKPKESEPTPLKKMYEEQCSALVRMMNTYKENRLTENFSNWMGALDRKLGEFGKDILHVSTSEAVRAYIDGLPAEDFAEKFKLETGG
ncbi:hypothetical protein LCGC14_1268150 [marine sediment metagenome]|uniref:Uncharacterized protein n=1 Tax=marine sediment metagenome TaxID=412755 RepID=A0A0F9P219_9ZZZZ